jgi:hypothetical protein
MKYAISALVVSSLLLAPAVRAQAPATGTLAADVLADWQGQKEQMMGLAGAMPEDKFGYKSTPAQRSYGEQILHVAQINMFLLQSLGAKAAPPQVNLKATSKADILQALAQSYDFGTAALKEFNDAAMAQAVDGPRFLGRATRARIAYFAMSHAMDIYGQMAVYLRLNDIVPPASRRGV